MAEEKKHWDGATDVLDLDSEDMEGSLMKFLEGGLVKSIERIVAKQTAVALGKMASNAEQAKVIRDDYQVQVSEGAGGSGTERAGSSGSSREARSVRAGSDLVESFDPENPDCNVDRWLNKIEQLAIIHDWSEYEMAYFMQAKLRGAARSWFNQLGDYDLTWGEWKEGLRKAFPKQQDFADSLLEMLARVKSGGETMTKYYHEKMALIERCEFTGVKALSCLIKGLPQELQANARAYQCDTPDELNTWFLSSFDRYQAGAVEKRSSSGSRQSMAKVSRRQDREYDFKARDKVRCYNCQEYGTHFSRDCPKPRVERCRRCGKTGHDRYHCPNSARDLSGDGSSWTSRQISPTSTRRSAKGGRM